MIIIKIDINLKTSGFKEPKNELAVILRELADKIVEGSFLPEKSVDRKGVSITIIQK